MNDNTEDTTENVFRLVTGGKPEEGPQPGVASIPQNTYAIIDREGNDYYAEGFALFTSQHIAIMRDTGGGAIPILIMPLDQVRIVELVEDDEVFEQEGLLL